MEQGVSEGTGKETRYYHALGRACDYVLRCKDCKRFVIETEWQKLGSCLCGNRKLAEITILTDEDRAVIDGLDFPHKAEFLAEFSDVV